MKKDSKKDSAVSPVIGTILLVAITVVLVAIISAVVMGMTGDVGQTYTVGVKVTNNATGTTVLFTGGADYDKMSAASINGSTNHGLSLNFKPQSFAKITGETVVIGTFPTGDQVIWSGKLE